MYEIIKDLIGLVAEWDHDIDAIRKDKNPIEAKLTIILAASECSHKVKDIIIKYQNMKK